MEAVASASSSRASEVPEATARSGFAAVLALSISAALAASLLAVDLAYLLLPLTDLPAPFPDHHQNAETLAFVFTFAAIVPIAAALIPRLADRIALRAGADVVAALAASLCVALLGLLVAVKVSERLPWGGGLGALLAAVLIWWLLAGAATALALGPRGREFVPPISVLNLLWASLAPLALLIALAAAFLDSISPLPLVCGLLFTAGLLVAYGRLELPRLPPRLGVGWDVAIVVVLLVAIPNLVIFYPEDPARAFETSIIHFHQNFFLGPANQVNGGGAMLVDTLSQYGVGSIVFIAGWFRLVGTSNGTLGILDGLLSGVVFAAGYFVLRAAGVSRLLAGGAMAVAVIALVYGLVYPVGGLLQHGAIRFGMPMAILAMTMAELRWPRVAAPARIATLLFVGLSSIWALEAFGYCVLTFGVVIVTRAALLAPGSRRAWFLRRGAEGAAACIAVHLVFALTTLVWAGSLPDWGQYINTLREFLSGEVGDLTYDFAPWSPGILVAGLLVASTVATALLIRRHRDLAVRERELTVAVAGSTAYGVALLSYLVNRSADHIVPYVSLPVLMAVTLWLSLMIRSPQFVPRPARQLALGTVAAVATVLVAVAWSGAGEHLRESAIAYVAPGGRPLDAAIDRLADPPPLSPGAAEAERLLDSYWPDQDEAAVLVEPDLGIEALARTGRINRIPLSDPWEDSFVADARLGEIDPALEDLSAGDMLLIDGNAAVAFVGYRRDPALDPLDSTLLQTIVPSGLAILQDYVLERLAARFRLRTVERGTDDLEVVELVDDPAAEPSFG